MSGKRKRKLLFELGKKKSKKIKIYQKMMGVDEQEPSQLAGKARAVRV